MNRYQCVTKVEKVSEGAQSPCYVHLHSNQFKWDNSSETFLHFQHISLFPQRKTSPFCDSVSLISLYDDILMRFWCSDLFYLDVPMHDVLAVDVTERRRRLERKHWINGSLCKLEFPTNVVHLKNPDFKPQGERHEERRQYRLSSPGKWWDVSSPPSLVHDVADNPTDYLFR